MKPSLRERMLWKLSALLFGVFVWALFISFGASLWLAMISINPMHDPMFWQPHAVVYHRV